MAAILTAKDDWKLDISYNLMGRQYEKLVCISCGQKCKRNDRIDTEDVWEDESSFCWECWRKLNRL